MSTEWEQVEPLPENMVFCPVCCMNVAPMTNGVSSRCPTCGRYFQ